MTEPEIDQALRVCSRLETSEEWLAATKTLLEKEKRRRIRLRWIRGGAAVALLTCAVVGAAFRDNRLSQISFKDPKFQVQIDTRVSPLFAKLRWYGLSGGTVSLREDWILRYAYDPRAATVRGYEFRVLQLKTGRYQFEVRGLSQDPRSIIDGRLRGYRWVGMGSVASPVEVNSGEKFELELAREPSVRVYDELQIVAPQPLAR